MKMSIWIIVFSILASAAIAQVPYSLQNATIIVHDSTALPGSFTYGIVSNVTYTRVVYSFTGSLVERPIILPKSNITSADALLRSTSSLSILAYDDPESGKTIPVIKLKNGRIIGKDFALAPYQKYWVWMTAPTNLTVVVQ